MSFNAQPTTKKITPSLVIRGITWTNICLFAVSLIFSGSDADFSLNPFRALSPSSNVLIYLGASGRIPVEYFQSWWSILTANWLHGSLLHILFNMMALSTVGPLAAAAFGPCRMFNIYTLAGAIGFFVSCLGQVPLTIGASSGLCGLIGACLYFGKSRGGPWGRQIYQQTSGWIISLVIIGFLLPGINNWGHGGGLAGGIALGFLLGYNDRRPENRADRILAMALTVVTLCLLIRPLYLLYA